MDLCCQDWQTEFFRAVQDLLTLSSVQALKQFPHHHRVSRYNHVLLVAQLSFRLSRRFHWDSRGVARAALLHDLYPGGKDANYFRHAWKHPGRALDNAQQVTALSDRERNIIASHMWPLCPTRPRYREALLVNLVDTVTAFVDVMGWNGTFLREDTDRTLQQCEKTTLNR